MQNRREFFKISAAGAIGVTVLGPLGCKPAAIDRKSFGVGIQLYTLRDAMAADALGNIGDVRSIERLIPLLNDQDQDVRFATAYALGNIGHPSAEQALTQTCSRDNCFVKVAAEEALVKVSEAQKNNAIPGRDAAQRASTK